MRTTFPVLRSFRLSTKVALTAGILIGAAGSVNARLAQRTYADTVTNDEDEMDARR